MTFFVFSTGELASCILSLKLSLLILIAVIIIPSLSELLEWTSHSIAFVV